MPSPLLSPSGGKVLYSLRAMNSAEEKLSLLLARILDIPPGQIRDDLSPETVETWDSFNGILIATELESTFNVRFSLEEVTATKNVGDIKKNLRNHGVEI